MQFVIFLQTRLIYIEPSAICDARTISFLRDNDKPKQQTEQGLKRYSN